MICSWRLISGVAFAHGVLMAAELSHEMHGFYPNISPMQHIQNLALISSHTCVPPSLYISKGCFSMLFRIAHLKPYPINPHVWIFNLLNGFSNRFTSLHHHCHHLCSICPHSLSMLFNNRRPAGLTMFSWPFSVYFPYSIHLHFKNANLIIHSSI